MSNTTFPYLDIGSYHEIVSGISTVFSFSDGTVKLTGPLGAGKTSLLREITKSLRDESFEVVELSTPPKSVDELQAMLIRQFKLGADLSFRKSLVRYLGSKPRDLQKLIVIIDNAEQMGTEALSGIFSLREIEHNGQLLVSLLLCGDKTLNAHIAVPELAALQADISLNYTVNPLEDGELAEFCSAYLQQTGKGRVTLSAAYLEQLQEQTRGLPGEVLTTLQQALSNPQFLSENSQEAEPVQEKPQPVVGKVIQKVAEQINNIPPETKRWLKPTATVLFTAAAASTVFVYYPRMKSLYQDLTGGSRPDDASPAPAQVASTTPAAPVQQAPTAQPPAAANPLAQAVTNSTSQPSVQPATPPAAAAVASTPPPAPAPAAPALGQGDVGKVLDTWVSAWSKQDTQAYLSLYHTDFASVYHGNRNSWREDRIRSLTKPARIEINISDLEIAGSDATGTTLRFWLDYQSPTYADRTYKELVIGQDVDGQLRILRELNREVQKQQIAASAVAASSPRATPPASTATVTMTPIGPPLTINQNATMSPLPSGRDNINEFISDWLNAWQHKNLDLYFSHYTPDFRMPQMASATEWRDDRTIKISRPPVIQLQLENMELIQEVAGETVLKLTLAYHSSFYADRTEKELHLQKDGSGKFQIVVEKNINVEALPISRLLPANTVAALEALTRSIAANRL